MPEPAQLEQFSLNSDSSSSFRTLALSLLVPSSRGRLVFCCVFRTGDWHFLRRSSAQASIDFAGLDKRVPSRRPT